MVTEEIPTYQFFQGVEIPEPVLTKLETGRPGFCSGQRYIFFSYSFQKKSEAHPA
jgi:hypothetical protein